MFVQLIPKTSHGEDIVEKHGKVFEVKDVMLARWDIPAAFRVTSLKSTNYFPFLGHRPYWFWLCCASDEHYDFQVLKE